MTTKTKLALAGFMLLAGYLLWTEHEAHVALALPYLPYLILLACPLLHVFMHRGHGGHGSIGEKANTQDQVEPR